MDAYKITYKQLMSSITNEIAERTQLIFSASQDDANKKAKKMFGDKVVSVVLFAEHKN